MLQQTTDVLIREMLLEILRSSDDLKTIQRKIEEELTKLGVTHDVPIVSVTPDHRGIIVQVDSGQGMHDISQEYHVEKLEEPDEFGS